MPRLLTNGRPRTPHYTAFKPPFALRHALLTVLAPSLTILASQNVHTTRLQNLSKSHLFLDILVYSVTELENSIDLVRQHELLQQQHSSPVWLLSPWLHNHVSFRCPLPRSRKMMKMKIVCSGETGAVIPDGTSAGLSVRVCVGQWQYSSLSNDQCFWSNSFQESIVFDLLFLSQNFRHLKLCHCLSCYYAR